jgi:hypothetical protein
MIKAIKILETQIHFVMNLTINIEYLIELNNIQEKGRSETLIKRGYINHIARLVMDDIIIKIYKLIDDDNYNFSKIQSEAYKINGVKERVEFKLFVEQTRKINKLSQELNFNGLRNMYVAHHDENRHHIPANIFEWKKLINLIYEAFDNIHYILKDSQVSWDSDKKILVKLLDDNSQMLRFILEKKENIKDNRNN